MIKIKLKVFLILIAVISFFFYFFNSNAQVVDLEAVYTSGKFEGQQPSGGLEPNSRVELTAVFNGDVDKACTGSLGYSLQRTMAHAIGGNLKNIEYLAKGRAGADGIFSYSFNSGPSGQKNVYWAIFYCWSSPTPEVALGTAQVWQSPRFEQTTVGVLTVPGRIKVPPVFFEIPNPIKAESFTDLINAIGGFIFALAIPIAVILIIYAGILFMTAAGKPDKIKKARDTLLYTLLGLAIVLIGNGFISLIKSILELGG